MNAIILNLTVLYRCLLHNIKVNEYTLSVNHLFAFLNVFMQYPSLYITMYAFHLLVCLHSWLCTLNIELLFIHTYVHLCTRRTHA